jgi:hypothetical protein
MISDRTDLLPEGQKDHVCPHPIGEGNRMVVFRYKEDPSVLRVPKRTETELKVQQQNGVDTVHSRYTQEEIRRYNALIDILGQFIAQVNPFTAKDMNGKTRTYAHQQYYAFDPRIDFSHLERCLHDVSPRDITMIKKFIRKNKNLIRKVGLVPDLAGHSNVGMTMEGRSIRLVDINNIRDVIGENWLQISEQEFWKDAWPLMIEGRKKVFHEILHPQYLDEFDYPVADMSIIQMQNWELALGTMTPETLGKDPIYGPLQSETRQKFLRLLLSMGRP